MKARNPEATRLEADYFSRVRAALSGRDSSEIDEVVQSLAEHVEEELSADPEIPGAGEPVSLVQMANVLERLGAPEAYGGEGEAGVDPPATPRVSRLAVAGALGAPVAVAAGLLFLAWTWLFNVNVHVNNLIAAALLLALVIWLSGFLVSLAARAAIRRSGGRLTGQRLAKWGIRLPVALFAVTMVLWFVWLGFDIAATRELGRNYQITVADAEIRNLWPRCRSVLLDRRPDAEITRELLDTDALEPDWAADARAGKATRGPLTLLSLPNDSAVAPRLKGVELSGTELNVLDDRAGIGAIVAGNDNLHLHIPVVRRGARWYLARQPVEIKSPPRPPA